jgi:hypothetical protein
MMETSKSTVIHQNNVAYYVFARKFEVVPFCV